MPKQVNVHDAKTHLSRLLAEVQTGAEIIIAKAGKPVARLSPTTQTAGPRRPGSAKGLLTMAEDFLAPLPTAVLDAFERCGPS